MTIVRLLRASLLVAAVATTTFANEHFASGFRVGEVSDRTAIVWARLTARAERNRDGVEPTPRMSRAREFTEPTKLPAEAWEGAVPGLDGQVRVGYTPNEDLSSLTWTGWQTVGITTDYVHQFALAGLQPATRYHLVVEGRTAADAPVDRSLPGAFCTAPAPEQWADLWFAVLTCQVYFQRDEPDGYRIFRSMLRQMPLSSHNMDLPSFLVSTGDSVYLDRDNPRATTLSLARLHWQRMYSLPLLRQFFRQVPGYWIKDDHDAFFDDCWPTYKAPWINPLKYEEGGRVFHEHVPLGPKPFRTFRWGKGVQIWLTENRDFRSPNDADDGPSKTVWGPEQLAWLKQSLLESDATFKILVSPTAIVGPDNPDQEDGHATTAFRHEGKAFRQWTREQGLRNLYLVVGDRHWQYASTDPLTGLREFACGPAADASVLRGPGFDSNYHSFYREGAGFVSVAVKKGIKQVLANPQRVVEENGAPTILIRIHDVDGRVVHEFRDTSPLNL